MTTLCGKGIWLAHSYDLQRAAEVAASIGGTHLLVKVGQSRGRYGFSVNLCAVEADPRVTTPEHIEALAMRHAPETLAFQKAEIAAWFEERYGRQPETESPAS